MPQYQVRHQTDQTCGCCSYYDCATFEDSFGPYTEETCAKGHYGHVGYFAEACKDGMFEGIESILGSEETESMGGELTNG